MISGLIAGGIVVILASIVGEIRIRTKKREIDELNKAISFLSELSDKRQKHIEELRMHLKETMDSSTELIHDYSIILKILDEELGRDEANRRYLKAKNKKPEDLNKLLEEIDNSK